MKYIIILAVVAIAVGVIGLIALSGCISEKKTNNDNLTSNIDAADNQNNTLNNTDTQISNDLSNLDSEDVSIDPEIQAIDSDLSELDALLQDDVSNTLADLN